MTDQIKLEVFSDYVWPWCYLSTGRIEKIKEEYSVKVDLIHFPLHPETPDDGMALEELFAGRNVDIDAMYTRMKGLMVAEGLEYGKRTHTYNSRLAQELGKWADEQSRRGNNYNAIHDALYRGYFVDGRNIGDEDTLVDIATNIGLPKDEVKAVLADRSHKNAVDADWSKSREYGVTGVPTFVAGGYSLVGAQPYEMLQQMMDQIKTSATESSP